MPLDANVCCPRNGKQVSPAFRGDELSRITTVPGMGR